MDSIGVEEKRKKKYQITAGSATAVVAAAAARRRCRTLSAAEPSSFHFSKFEKSVRSKEKYHAVCETSCRLDT